MKKSSLTIDLHPDQRSFLADHLHRTILDLMTPSGGKLSAEKVYAILSITLAFKDIYFVIAGKEFDPASSKEFDLLSVQEKQDS